VHGIDTVDRSDEVRASYLDYASADQVSADWQGNGVTKARCRAAIKAKISGRTILTGQNKIMFHGLLPTDIRFQP
jgi:hypothetical protein